MRNLIDVIDEILPHVPTSETLFIERCEHIKKGLPYKAPESQGMSWVYIQKSILSLCEITDSEHRPRFEWQRQILSIFSTIPVDKIELRPEGE